MNRLLKKVITIAFVMAKTVYAEEEILVYNGETVIMKDQITVEGRDPLVVEEGGTLILIGGESVPPRIFIQHMGTFKNRGTIEVRKGTFQSSPSNIEILEDGLFENTGTVRMYDNSSIITPSENMESVCFINSGRLDLSKVTDFVRYAGKIVNEPNSVVIVPSIFSDFILGSFTLTLSFYLGAHVEYRACIYSLIPDINAPSSLLLKEIESAIYGNDAHFTGHTGINLDYQKDGSEFSNVVVANNPISMDDIIERIENNPSNADKSFLLDQNLIETIVDEGGDVVKINLDNDKTIHFGLAGNNGLRLLGEKKLTLAGMDNTEMVGKIKSKGDIDITRSPTSSDISVDGTLTLASASNSENPIDMEFLGNIKAKIVNISDNSTIVIKGAFSTGSIDESSSGKTGVKEGEEENPKGK
ncbi:MAG: hypothetical protein LBI95_00820 [Holosporales bacterium]|jgi:hypothetical protein|nr:hypothetical protein [Holosporales bacterium]